MSRIPYLPADLDAPEPLVSSIRARRGGQLLNLDRLLLHSPPLAQGWNSFMGAVRKGLALDPYLGELAICVVAVINNAPYEFHHHAPEWKAAGGRDDQIKALAKAGQPDFDHALFDDRDLAIIDLTIEMTRQVSVTDQTFARALAHVPSHQHLVELLVTIGAYNMVSRFLVATRIDPE